MIPFIGNTYVQLMARDVENRGYISKDLNIIIITFSLFLYGSRMYSRIFLSKTPGIDDAIITVGLILAVSLSILEIKAVEYGAGRQIADVAANDPDDLANFFKLIYFAGTGIVRLGITSFLPRITCGLAREKSFNRTIYILAAAIIALTLGAFFGLLFECWPVKNLWNKGQEAATCYSANREADLMYTHAAVGIFFDAALLVIPLWILKSSALVLKPRLIIIFSVALLAVACGLIRLLVIVKVNMAENTTYNIISASIWTDLEIHVGIWVSCFPALQPLLRSCTRRLGIKSSTLNTTPITGAYDRYGQSTSRGTRSRNNSDAWIMLENSASMRNKIESDGNGQNDGKEGIAISTKVEITTEDTRRL